MGNSGEASREIRARALISGRVQGVNYRSSTVRAARKLGLRGWVRNLPDGGVEAVFEGQRESVERILQWCQEGPPSARVEGVAVEMAEPEGIQGFEIEY